MSYYYEEYQDYDYANQVTNQYAALQQQYFPLEPQPPIKPEYNFESSSEYKTLYVKKSLTRLMPVGFDPITETIIKKLNKKGVKRRKTIMPRIFKLSAFAALSVLIWDFVAHANDITIFLVHAFTGK